MSCETSTICDVYCRCRGPWGRPSAVPSVEFSQCATCERNLGQAVPELGWEVRRSVKSTSRLNLVRTVLFREVVVGSLSILRARHEQPLRKVRMEGSPCEYSSALVGQDCAGTAGLRVVCGM